MGYYIEHRTHGFPRWRVRETYNTIVGNTHSYTVGNYLTRKMAEAGLRRAEGRKWRRYNKESR